MPVANSIDEIKVSTNHIQVVNERQSRRQRLKIKMSTKHSDDAAPIQESAVAGHAGVPPQEWKEETKKKRRNAGADASGVTSTPRRAPAARVISSQKPPSQTNVADEQLPPPLPYETLRSYWLRLYREASAACGKEARTIVHAAAHTLVGMGSARADYVLLGQLRQTAGNWATVLHWLLECGTRELADPRSYLRAIAARQSAAGPSSPSAHAGKRRPSRQIVADPTDTSGDSLAVTEQGPVGCEEATPVEPSRLAVSDAADESASDPVDLCTCVSAASLWQVARQRLHTEVTAAQFTSWLMVSDLVRAPDGTYLLLTRTTFAAEHIARL